MDYFIDFISDSVDTLATQPLAMIVIAAVFGAAVYYMSRPG
jgi:hypothetical protein